MSVGTGGFIEQVVLAADRSHFQGPETHGRGNQGQLRPSDDGVGARHDDHTQWANQAVPEGRGRSRDTHIVEIQDERLTRLHVEAVSGVIFLQGLEARKVDSQPSGAAELQVVVGLGDRGASDTGFQSDHLAAGEGANINRGRLLPVQAIGPGIGRRVRNGD